MSAIRRWITAGALLATSTACWGATQPEVDELRAELERLRARISELEALKGRLQELENKLDQAGAGETVDTVAEKEAVSESTGDTEAQERIDIGGAFRFNYFWKDFDENLRTKRGDIGLDLFRINVDGQKKNVLISAEYRWYPFMDTVHHGWVGYQFDDASRVEAGITKVPFGILPYASHNFWFGVPYYIGLADDYDAGVKYVRQHKPWDLQVAFFKNGELGNAADLERYSYDVVAPAGAAARNEETNQLNARLAYTLERGGCATELGVSAAWGELHNRDTGDTGSHWAGAGHMDARCGRWNYQLEAGRYGYDPRNPAGVSSETVTLGAFAAPHEIAAYGTFAAANIAYNVPTRWPAVDLLTCYNDFSVLVKDNERFDNSYLNTTGCGIGVGPTFTYVDVIRAKNMVFFGNGSLAGGGAQGWDTRFNINVGYYF